jgi:hypothetical protein
MKLQKKYAITCVDLILIFLEDGFLPMDKMEGVMIGKILGFGRHHKMVKEDIDGCKAWKEIGPIKKTARLDLTEDEMSAIIEIDEEMEESNSLEEDVAFFEPTIKYLMRILCSSKEN